VFSSADFSYFCESTAQSTSDVVRSDLTFCSPSIFKLQWCVTGTDVLSAGTTQHRYTSKRAHCRRGLSCSIPRDSVDAQCCCHNTAQQQQMLQPCAAAAAKVEPQSGT